MIFSFIKDQMSFYVVFSLLEDHLRTYLWKGNYCDSKLMDPLQEKKEKMQSFKGRAKENENWVEVPKIYGRY